ncbi:MAG: ABC transporter substrate-binding protein [bacterium]|nr:ABC transporter substrate-binding protein [bacterium]
MGSLILKVRYIYWVFLAFIKKNLQLLIISFLCSLLAVISIISFTPYVIDLLTSKKVVIGIAGKYTIDNLPEEVVSQFSNSLLHISDSGELIPLLADSWEPLEGGSQYIFHIKKDLVWNDGKPFVASDINYTFKDVEVIADNEYLLRFKLKKPLAIFPNFLTKPIVKYPLVGVAGVYKVGRVKTKAGHITTLQLNPNQAGLPVIIYKFYDNDTKLVQAYKLGEISQMSTTRSSIAEVFQSWNNTEIVTDNDYSRVIALFFNFNDPLMGEDKDIRRAIAESIDKSKFSSYGTDAYSPISPQSWAHNPLIKRYTYNPSVSGQILKNVSEASDSAKLTISTYYDQLALAGDIKEDLQGVGLDVGIEVISGSIPNTFQLFLAEMSLSKDPDQYFFWHSTQKSGNITSYNNVRIDKLLEDGRNTYTTESRKQIYDDFQKVLVDDMPAFFLYYPHRYTIMRK